MIPAFVPPNPPLTMAHAHNDYAQARPLLGALGLGFGSIEADVYLVNGKLLVAHDRDQVRPDRELDAMYLRPLAERIRANGGRVYPGSDAELTLLIDIKEDGTAAFRALHELLLPYRAVLTRVEQGRLRRGALRIVISGDRDLPLIAQGPDRLAFIDGRPEDVANDRYPASAMPLISTNWLAFTGYMGDAPLPAPVRDKVIALVSATRRQGRQLRFWATPDSPALWAELRRLGVGVIGTDRQADLAAFLRR